MAAMSGHEEDAMLVSQCLDFCQMLAGKSLTFSFSLTLGTGFNFSVDTMGKGALTPKEEEEETNSIHSETKCQKKRTISEEQSQRFN